MQIVDRAVDRRLKMASLISSDLQHFDQFYLVGRRIDKIFSSHCPGFIGQIMIPCGSMTVDIWMTDFRPFYKALCAHSKKPKLTVAEFKQLSDTMTSELSEIMHAAGCTLYHYMSMPKYAMLWTPPGYHLWCQAGGGDSVARNYGLTVGVAPAGLVVSKNTISSMTEYANLYLADPATAKSPVLKAEMEQASRALKSFKQPMASLELHISQAMMAQPVHASASPQRSNPSASPQRLDPSFVASAIYDQAQEAQAQASGAVSETVTVTTPSPSTPKFRFKGKGSKGIFSSPSTPRVGDLGVGPQESVALSPLGPVTQVRTLDDNEN